MPNPNQELLPGQFTQVRLLLDVLEDAIVVPRKAISIEKGGSFIFVIRPDSIVEKRYIETADEQNNKIVITRGLSPNESIVTEGYHKLTHGQRAIPVRKSEKNAVSEPVEKEDR